MKTLLMYNALCTKRIRSIDVLGGITILEMIFVNYVSGVSGVPSWMNHRAGNAVAMIFVDRVFPFF